MTRVGCFRHVCFETCRHVLQGVGAGTGRYRGEQHHVVATGFENAGTSHRIAHRTVHPAGNDCPEFRADPACIDVARVADQIMTDVGCWLAGDVPAEHRHELVIDVLPERPDRQRRPAEIVLDSTGDACGVFGFEALARIERRERALRGQPDSGVSRRQKLFGSRSK